MWRGLQAARKIAKTEVVGGTDYKYWRSFLKDLSDKQLMAGLQAIPDFHDILTVSAFKKVCIDSANAEAISEIPPERRLAKTETNIGPAERKRRMAEMRARLGI